MPAFLFLYERCSVPSRSDKRVGKSEKVRDNTGGMITDGVLYCEEEKMIVSGNNELRAVSGISADEERDIINFLQGAVYCWCKNRKNEWFSLRDLMGGDNYYWNDTPMIKLWEKHSNLKKADPVDEAGKDGGWLLKKVVQKDKRKFETKEEDMIRKYRWIQ